VEEEEKKGPAFTSRKEDRKIRLVREEEAGPWDWNLPERLLQEIPPVAQVSISSTGRFFHHKIFSFLRPVDPFSVTATATFLRDHESGGGDEKED